MARKKKTSSENTHYFPLETQEAIVKYLESESKEEREKLYKEYIHYAFDKLSEFTIHSGKFYYYDTDYEDLKNNTVSFLVEKMNRFRGSKGKAFSYFTKVARNFLIQENRKSYKAKTRVDDLEVVDMQRDLTKEVFDTERKDSLRDFITLWIEHVENNLEKIFSSEKEISIGDSIIELFRTVDDIEDFNKKKLYILIRERTGYKTSNITPIVNKLKKDFYSKYILYSRGELVLR